jgi:hypothetical protein
VILSRRDPARVTRSGGFVVLDTEQNGRELCRHRTQARADACARNACPTRFSNMHRQALADEEREDKAPR